MSQLLNLSKIFTAAGGTAHPDGKGIYLLYVEPEDETNSLLSKLWTGEEFGDDQDLIANSVHPNTPAAYLLSPGGKSVVYFSTSSILSISTYDDDEGAWNDEDIPKHKVHPNSKIAATLGTDGRRRVFFQNPSQHLIYVDENWKATTINANIQEGSPLAISIAEGKLRLYYLGNDKILHYTTQGQDGKWIDSTFSTYVFDKKFKRILVMPANEGKLEVLGFTEGKEMWRVTEEGKKTVLGSVDDAGKFVPSTKEEAGYYFYYSFYYAYW